jgi:cellulose synthase/poly-beta-1,6-N-acetylglucosamine synthase-like glycosyltransferase
MTIALLSAVYFAAGAFLFYQAWVHWQLMRAPASEATANPRELPPALPPVVVQLPLFNEPSVVIRLLDAVAELDWPDPLSVQILDDSTDHTSQLVGEWLAQPRGPHRFTHLQRTDRKGFKAGALAAAAVPPDALVAIFDADFVPAPSFLRRAIPRLLENPRAAAIQARWDHLNPAASPLTSVQALNLDAHFAVEQEGRSRLGYWNSFNGTAGVWRQAAIADAGGWSHDMLAEDLDLSIRAQLAGWPIVYADDIGAPAELPAAMPAYLSQQRRWTQGGAACAAKHLRSVRQHLPPGRERFHATAMLLASSIHIPVWLMTTASVPLLIEATRSSNLPLRIGIIFSLTLSMFVALYLTAARRRCNTKHFPWRMLAMLALGSGTTFHNAKAVLAGWRRRDAEFVRTPKAGAVEPLRISRAGFALSEWTHVLWFGAGVAWGIHSGEWGLVPFHALIATGYAWVAWAR